LAAGCNKTPVIVRQESPAPKSAIDASPALQSPIGRALERITKKSFGIKISPESSPVSPERFSGYHTGVDFETFPEEQNIDVPIFAVCGGKLLLKKYATGYGGGAVESCKIEGRDVTIIYGHLKLASIAANIGDGILAGQQIAVLGKGYSSETDGERKHLHLGIHKGISVILLGYVQNKSQLDDWLDASKYLK